MKHLLLILLFVTQLAEAADVELVCPCSVESTSQTAFTITLGLKNVDASQTSGALRLKMIAGTTPSFFDSTFAVAGFADISTTLSPGQSVASQAYQSGFVAPTEGDYFITVVLEEFQSGSYQRIDSIRMRESLTVTRDGGHSVSSTTDAQHGIVFFDGTPTGTFTSSQVTLNLPAIKNVSSTYTTGNLRLDVQQGNSTSIFGSSFFTASSIDLAQTLSPNGTLAATQLITSFSEQSNDGFDFFHLVLIDESLNFPLAFQTIKVNTGTISSRSFSLDGIELLEDDDGDGVSNFNERLAGTNKDDAASTPGSSQLDVLVYYSESVPALYSGDHLTRIDHIIEATNQFYADSGLAVFVNLVDAQMLAVSESLSNSTMFGLMTAESGLFANLSQTRTTLGADIVVMLRPIITGSSNCGIASLSGAGLKGDLSSVVNAQRASTALFIDCRDNVTAHEIGHILGLTHSRIESARLDDSGTFDWSVGHGVSSKFVTIMANTTDYGDAPELNQFASPLNTCVAVGGGSFPCGIVKTDLVNGADAVLSLKVTRFQAENFTASVAAADADGDSVTLATMIPVDGSLNGGAFGTISDVDYFSFMVTSGRSYTVATSNPATAVDTALELFSNDAATSLASDDNSGTGLSSSITFTAASSGRRFIRVSAAAGSAGGYNIAVTESSGASIDSGVVLVAAVLPASRSVMVDATATAFATVINGGSAAAMGCSISPGVALPIDFYYQQTDPVTNAATGDRNLPADLAAGAAQSFIIGVTPNRAFGSTVLNLRYICNNSSEVTAFTGLNTLRLSASTTPIPDVVALVATIQTDGIVHIPGATGTGVFSVASVNVGASGQLQVTADTGNAVVPLTVSLCETDPATAACINPTVPTTGTVTTTINANATPTFGIFVAAQDTISLDPANKRIFVRFSDSSDIIRGSTSVAVQTD